MIVRGSMPFSQTDWTDRQQYGWLTTLPLRSFSWEVVRRVPAYGAAWERQRSAQTMEEVKRGVHILTVPQESFGSAWGLLGPLEDPRLDARAATVFWDPKACPAVLPALALPDEGGDCVDLLPANHAYRVAVYDQPYEGRQQILFADQGRFLQLDVRGTPILQAGRLLPDLLSSAENITARADAARQLADLVKHRALRPQLHPPAKQGLRLSIVLQALDGELAGASHRDIAIALFGAEKARAGWRSRSMRDKVANAIKYGVFLMNGGYRKYLR
jgi:hypothetical protein